MQLETYFDATTWVVWVNTQFATISFQSCWFLRTGGSLINLDDLGYVKRRWGNLGEIPTG